jgi:Xaa-Pro aminopeptidase
VPEFRRRRLASLLPLLSEHNLDAVLVSSAPNIRYLTGFSGSSALLLVSQADTALITDFRYKTQVAEEVGDLARILIDTESLWNSLWKHLSRLSARVIGFESAHMPHRDFERLTSAGARWNWKGTHEIVESLRERKAAEELTLIEQAANMATGALERVVPGVREGMTENQVAGLIERELREMGSEGAAFPTIVASGPRSALPHARTSARSLVRGDLLLIDFGAVAGGYCSDITRTFSIGRAGQREREVHAVVCSANETASAALRAGMRGDEADAVARAEIERAGFGSEFGHGLGHGIGLEVHEAPRLSRTADKPLQAGAVVTVEPGIYIPGWGGVRIEDDVYIGVDSPRLLTNYSRELLELR